MSARTRNIAAVIAFAGSAAVTNAQYASVNPAPGAEHGHTAILNTMYGGAWTAMGVDATNGDWSAHRITDYGALLGVGLQSISPKLSQDDIWSAGNGMEITITAKAKFAGDSHVLGWIDDTLAEPAFQPLLSSSAIDTTVVMTPSASFRWAFQNISTGRVFTSRPQDNLGVGAHADETFDQLVTYHVTGPSGQSEIALFWEDRIGGQSADYDYNDAAFALSVVPAPGTGMLAGLGLIGLASRRRQR